MIKNNYRINPSVRIYSDLLNKNFLVINHENKEQFIIENIETLDNFMRIIDSKKDITEDMQKLEAKCKKLRFIIKNNDPQIEIYNKYVTKYGWDDFFLDSLSDCQNVKIIKSQSKLKFSSDIYQYYDKILRRRTIRRFSSEKISNEIVVNILKIGIENYLDTGGLHKVLNGLTFYLVINYSPDLVSGIYKYEIKT